MTLAELVVHDDALIENLNRRGVRVLTGGDVTALDMRDAGLAAGLVSSDDWRVRFAFVSWMLLRPADVCVDEARRLMTPAAADQLGMLFAVAACLQARYRADLLPVVKPWRTLSSLDATAANRALGGIAIQCEQYWDPDVRWLVAFHQVARSLLRVLA